MKLGIVKTVAYENYFAMKKECRSIEELLFLILAQLDSEPVLRTGLRQLAKAITFSNNPGILFDRESIDMLENMDDLLTGFSFYNQCGYSAAIARGYDDDVYFIRRNEGGV